MIIRLGSLLVVAVLFAITTEGLAAIDTGAAVSFGHFSITEATLTVTLRGLIPYGMFTRHVFRSRWGRGGDRPHRRNPPPENSIPFDAPLENVLAIYDAVKDYPYESLKSG